jgi:quercetin dioxygenase-like cupin family protein
MNVIQVASAPSNRGPSATFSGSVFVTPLVQGQDPAHLTASSVTFECCARSAWHSHPCGQLLVVTAGSGLIQEKGGPIQRIEVGHVIWTPPGVTHWHGASQSSSMTHVAIQERSPDGQVVNWQQLVTDNEYNSNHLGQS